VREPFGVTGSGGLAWKPGVVSPSAQQSMLMGHWRREGGAEANKAANKVQLV